MVMPHLCSSKLKRFHLELLSSDFSHVTQQTLDEDCEVSSSWANQPYLRTILQKSWKLGTVEAALALVGTTSPRGQSRLSPVFKIGLSTDGGRLEQNALAGVTNAARVAESGSTNLEVTTLLVSAVLPLKAFSKPSHIGFLSMSVLIMLQDAFNCYMGPRL